MVEKYCGSKTMDVSYIGYSSERKAHIPLCVGTEKKMCWPEKGNWMTQKKLLILKM